MCLLSETALENRSPVSSSKNTIPSDKGGEFVKDFVVGAEGREARYVRVQADNIGLCPPGHPGAGGKAWLFVDEILVNSDDARREGTTR